MGVKKKYINNFLIIIITNQWVQESLFKSCLQLQ